MELQFTQEQADAIAKTAEKVAIAFEKLAKQLGMVEQDGLPKKEFYNSRLSDSYFDYLKWKLDLFIPGENRNRTTITV